MKTPAILDAAGNLRHDWAAPYGCSKQHLSAVLHGRRPCSAELRAKLEANGIVLPKLRDASDRWGSKDGAKKNRRVHKESQS